MLQAARRRTVTRRPPVALRPPATSRHTGRGSPASSDAPTRASHTSRTPSSATRWPSPRASRERPATPSAVSRRAPRPGSCSSTPGLHRPRTLLGQRLNDLDARDPARRRRRGFCLPPPTSASGPGDTYIARELIEAAAGEAQAGRRHRDEVRPGRPSAPRRAPHRHRPARGAVTRV